MPLLAYVLCHGYHQRRLHFVVFRVYVVANEFLTDVRVISVVIGKVPTRQCKWW
jgi:hypothetical protein